MSDQYSYDKALRNLYYFEIIQDPEWETLAGLKRFENNRRPIVYRNTPNDCWYVSGAGLWFIKYDPTLPIGVAWSAELRLHFMNEEQAIRAATGFMHITCRDLLEEIGFCTEDWMQN